MIEPDDVPDTYWILDFRNHRFILSAEERDRLRTILTQNPPTLIEGKDYWNCPFLLPTGDFQCLFLSSPEIREFARQIDRIEKQSRNFDD